MKSLENRITFLLAILGAILYTAGCGNGTSSPTDAGHDGDDTVQFECTSAAQCDDQNPCTDDQCVAGKCRHINNTLPCEDGNLCTEADYCKDGSCVSGRQKNCDDGNVCTDDSCDPKSGCVHTNNQSSCDDGNSCTEGEKCIDGTCTGGSAVDCDDGNVCTDDSCDPKSGCVHINNTAPCDDGQACSTNDRCKNGVCVGDTTLDCNDNNPCTEDSCDDTIGCVHINNTAPCDDSNVCTVNDRCADGRCVGGGALNCDDSNPCTDDSCNPATGCVYTNNTASCDDSNPCTMNDRCNAGRCAGVPLDADGDGYIAAGCLNGNDCCDSGSESSAGCNAQRAGQINPGVFEGSSAGNCFDGVDNDCDGYVDNNDTGCSGCQNDAQCNDNNVCNGTERCVNNQCQGGTPLTCNDNNVCTDDSCDPASGCVYTNNNAPCDDNNACTVADTCTNGRCVGSLIDADGDTFTDAACGGTDCNDADPNVNPDAVELCWDSVDNNCNNIVNEQCPTCSSVDTNAELKIDNELPYSTMVFNAGDEAINLFVVESAGYKVMQVKAGFFDIKCGQGGDQGRYSAHVYAIEGGQVGTLLASSSIQTINISLQTPGNCDTQQIAWATFTLTPSVPYRQGQPVLVSVKSADNEIDEQNNGDGFVPVISAPVLVPYFGGYYRDSATNQLSQVGPPWLIRVGGCAEGPWLDLSAHTQNPAILQPNVSATTTATLRNRGFAPAANVTGTISCSDPKITITQANSSFGTIAVNSTANSNPAFSLRPATNAFGIYYLDLVSTDGLLTWYDSYPVYVQGTGCTTQNRTLQVDSGTLRYVMPLKAGEMTGNYFVVDSNTFTLTSVDVQIYRTAGPSSSNFRINVYTYRDGAPDQRLFQGSWTAVSGNEVITKNFPVSPALTFKKDDIFFVAVESQSNLSNYQYFAPLLDDGSGNSWGNCVYYQITNNVGTWLPLGVAAVVRPNGCQATEIVYDSHTQTPAEPTPGQSVTLAITLKNIGAIAANNVSAALSSSTPDVTVTVATRTYGTIAAGATATQYGFQVQIASGASQYQYMLDLDITDGNYTWKAKVPLRLAGGYVDLDFSEFSTSLAGSDIYYNFTIRNAGNVDCVTPFRVDLYVDRETAPASGQAGDWNETVNFLAAGATKSYNLVYNDAPAGQYTAWARVDTMNAVTESNENNNLAGPSNQTIGTTDIFQLLDPPRRWFASDIPVRYRFVANNTQQGLTQADARAAVINGFMHWQDIPNSSIAFTQVADAPAGSGGFIYNDGQNTVSFNDPRGELDSGALAATLPVYTTSQSVQVNGVTFYRMTDSDMVVNNGVTFGTHAQASSSNCWAYQYFDLEGVMTHEQGHFIGLDHVDIQDATMYYAIGPCDPSKTTLEQSDINGAAFIYP